MGLLQDLKSILEANAQVPAYISFLPPSSGIALYTYQAPMSDPKFDYAYHNVQVVCKYPDYETAELKAWNVYWLFQALTGAFGNPDIV